MAPAAQSLILALLVALAGCSALPGGPSTPTVSPASVPTDPFVLEATPVSTDRVYLGDVASYEPGSVVHELLAENASVDLHRSRVLDLRQLDDTYDYVRVGDRVLTNVTFRSEPVRYRLRLRTASSANESEAVSAEALSPQMRRAVATALAQGTFNATAHPRDGYYSVAHYERVVFGSAVSDRRYVEVDGTYYEPVAAVLLPGRLYEARPVSADAVDEADVVAYVDLSVPVRRRFDAARSPDGELASTIGDAALPVVRYEGQHYRFDRVDVVGGFGVTVRVWATGDPVSPDRLYAELDAARIADLQPPVRGAVERAVAAGRTRVEPGPARDHLRDVLREHDYVHVDGRFYRLCSPAVAPGC